MTISRYQGRNYLLAVGIGAFMGGCIVLATTHAIPKMISRLMTEMMGRMMIQMGGENCSPQEL